MPARVAVDARMIGASGIGRYLSELLPRLVAGAAAEYTLLGAPETLARHRLGAGAGVVSIDVHAPIYSVAEQLELRRRTPAAELFWSPHYNIPLFHRGRLLVTVHDVLHVARPQYVQGAHRRAYARLMFAAVRRRATRILCDSRFTADELIRHVGVPAGAIDVVHLGVDDVWFADGDAGAPPHPRPYLVSIGNVKPHKNLARMVAAFAELAHEVPHDLVIIGRREGFITGDAEVVERAARLGDRVRFTGEIDDALLRRYLRHAAALLFPSLYEGFGLPPLEAMAAGCPVLSSDAGSLPEVCGDAALYFDPLDPRDLAAKVRTLLGSATLAAELRERGATWARRYSWERCTAETARVIEAAAGR